MTGNAQRGAIAAAPYVFTIVFFDLWEAACRLFRIPVFFLPAPSVIAQAGIEYWSQLLFHSFHTLWMTVAGFAIAVVPILILWFGVGWIPPVMTAFLISFFPIVVNVATGLSTIEPELEDVMKALGAKKWDILVKIGIPRSMPYLFASLKVAITLAYVGSVIAESNASRYGIGNLITRASADFNVPLVFAALIALAILGVIIYAATVELERRMTGWAHRSGMGQG